MLLCTVPLAAVFPPGLLMEHSKQCFDRQGQRKAQAFAWVDFPHSGFRYPYTWAQRPLLEIFLILSSFACA